MQSVWRWVAAMGIGLTLSAVTGCGSSPVPSSTAEAGSGPGGSISSDVGPTGTTPGSADPTGTAAPVSSSSLDGTYALTGTQTCKTPNGASTVSTFPLFEGASITFAGDRATVELSSEPRTVHVDVAGTSFHVSVGFDLEGNIVTTVAGAPLGATDLLFEVEGTLGADGKTITGTGRDAGLNCSYRFSGTRSDASSTTIAPTAPAVADPCSHIVDPTTGVPYTEWSDVGPGLGPVHLVSACELPYALATFEGTPTEQLVHWDGTSWKIADRLGFCSSYTGPKPQTSPGEGQRGRIWYVECVTMSVTTTRPEATTTSLITAAASAGPCTRAAIQAALPPGEFVQSDPLCDGEWATTDPVLGTDDVRVLLRWNGREWVTIPRLPVCDDGSVPASIYELACLTS